MYLIARCTFDGNPDNGYTTDRYFRMGEPLSHGSNVKYACDRSYTLVGSHTRHCDDGSWNTSRPSCKGKLISCFMVGVVIIQHYHVLLIFISRLLASCDDPGFLKGGGKIGNKYSHGQTVTYECTAKGYSLVGNPTLTCNDGSWDSKKPECKGK